MDYSKICLALVGDLSLKAGEWYRFNLCSKDLSPSLVVIADTPYRKQRYLRNLEQMGFPQTFISQIQQGKLLASLDYTTFWLIDPSTQPRILSTHVV